jgi:hypothetical protein
LPDEEKARPDCAQGLGEAARLNARSLRELAWSPFGRPEIGWQTYAPLVGREVGSTCPPDSRGFAEALAKWKAEQRAPGGGVFSEADFALVRGAIQSRRPFVRLTAQGACPAPPVDLETALMSEGYAGKVVQLRPDALQAYRRMVAQARADDPRIAADPRNLTIFSGFRSPESDAARCEAEQNCDGVVRATCSPHRTGLAVDLYVGQSPGFGPDSSADENRSFMSRTPAYLWLVANASKFGFTPYPFEPWHWEWTGREP